MGFEDLEVNAHCYDWITVLHLTTSCYYEFRQNYLCLFDKLSTAIWKWLQNKFWPQSYIRLL